MLPGPEKGKAGLATKTSPVTAYTSLKSYRLAIDQYLVVRVVRALHHHAAELHDNIL
jgi:hypothetical protein